MAVLGLANLLRLMGTLCFRRFTHLRLTEHRQQNDPPPRREPVRNAHDSDALGWILAYLVVLTQPLRPRRHRGRAPKT